MFIVIERNIPEKKNIKINYIIKFIYKIISFINF